MGVQRCTAYFGFVETACRDTDNTVQVITDESDVIMSLDDVDQIAWVQTDE